MGEAADTDERRSARIVAAPVCANRSRRRTHAELARQRALRAVVRPRSFSGFRPPSYCLAARSAPRARRTSRRTQRTTDARSDGEPHRAVSGDR